MDTNTAITALINEEIKELGIPLTSVAETSGIAYTTLSRKTKGSGAWTATEIARIARALRVPTSRLFPAEFFQAQTAAA